MIMMTCRSQTQLRKSLRDWGNVMTLIFNLHSVGNRKWKAFASVHSIGHPSRRPLISSFALSHRLWCLTDSVCWRRESRAEMFPALTPCTGEPLGITKDKYNVSYVDYIQSIIAGSGSGSAPSCCSFRSLVQRGRRRIDHLKRAVTCLAARSETSTQVCLCSGHEDKHSGTVASSSEDWRQKQFIMFIVLEFVTYITLVIVVFRGDFLYLDVVTRRSLWI